MRVEFLERATWLDEERITAYAWIFVCLYAASAAIWIVLSPNMVDLYGRPLGSDFMTVWSAGKLVLAGEPAAAYDYARHFDVQRQALPWPNPADAPYYGWHYPPFFMFVAAGLAVLPYGPALALWTAATLPVYLAAVRAILARRRWLLFGLAFPAVFVNLGHGQSGFITAGLLGLGLLLLEKRPLLAGILFGMLAYKPQLGMLLPLVLLADRRWHAFTAAAATVLAMSLLTYVVLGAEVWRAFFASVTLTRTLVLEQGAMGWEKMQSVFATMRLLGAGIPLAYAVQAAVALCAGAAVLSIWLRPIRMPLKGAALVTGGLLITPYVFDYDLMLLALPIAWLAAEGLRTRFLSWEKIVLLGAWILPFVARGVAGLGVPLVPVVLLLLLALILRRSNAEREWSREAAAQQA